MVSQLGPVRCCREQDKCGVFGQERDVNMFYVNIR